MTDAEQDPLLWVVSAFCSERDWLVEGNPHTHPGRLAIWCPHTGTGYNLSKDEVRETSTEGRYWIRGFVVGNEPNSPLDKHGYEKSETSKAFRAWDAARPVYLASGHWPVDAPRRS